MKSLHQLPKKWSCLTLICAVFVHFTLGSLSIALAQTPMASPSPSPTPTPTAPQGDVLFKGEAPCFRQYIYRNRTYPVDSSRKQDGEGLRQVFKAVPQAQELLNSYQSKVRSAYIPAFLGTAGGIVALGGGILFADTIQSDVGKRDTRYSFLIGGLFLILAGYGYGQFAIKDKEKTLEKAVKTYNDSVPALERIQVGLTPISNDTGGAIKTIVPF